MLRVRIWIGRRGHKNLVHSTGPGMFFTSGESSSSSCRVQTVKFPQWIERFLVNLLVGIVYPGTWLYVSVSVPNPCLISCQKVVKLSHLSLCINSRTPTLAAEALDYELAPWFFPFLFTRGAFAFLFSELCQAITCLGVYSIRVLGLSSVPFFLDQEPLHL